MEMTKINLNSEKGILYECFMRDDEDGKPTRLAYNIEEIRSDETLCFDDSQYAVYHLLLDGEVQAKTDKGKNVNVHSGDVFYCELEESMEVNGSGKMLSMHMEKSIHGGINVWELKKEQVVKVGEIIGESCLGFTCLDGDFSIESANGLQTVSKGEMIIVAMGKKELSKIRLISDEPVHIAQTTCVKLYDSDFSKHMGLYTVEQGYGYCKVRLDIQKEHMNPIGSVHGGALFTMADEACGIAASTTGGICTTVDSHIEFLNAAIGVKYLTAEAKPKKIGKKIRSFIVEIKDERDRLIATADFIFFCLQ